LNLLGARSGEIIGWKLNIAQKNALLAAEKSASCKELIQATLSYFLCVSLRSEGKSIQETFFGSLWVAFFLVFASASEAI
jgi:hypothetical protein